MSESPVTSQSPRPQSQPPAGRYRIDAGRSAVTFATRHLFGLAPVRGTFTLRDGTVIVADPVAGSSVPARAALCASARLSVDRYAHRLTAFRGLAARRLTVDLDIVARRDEATRGTSR